MKVCSGGSQCCLLSQMLLFAKSRTGFLHLSISVPNARLGNSYLFFLLSRQFSQGPGCKKKQRFFNCSIIFTKTEFALSTFSVNFLKAQAEEKQSFSRFFCLLRKNSGKTILNVLTARLEHKQMIFSLDFSQKFSQSTGWKKQTPNCVFLIFPSPSRSYTRTPEPFVGCKTESSFVKRLCFYCFVLGRQTARQQGSGVYKAQMFCPCFRSFRTGRLPKKNCDSTIFV